MEKTNPIERMSIPNFVLIFALLVVGNTGFTQTVTNGTFNSGQAGWGCSPETNPASVYGGPNSNTVAEVDIQAGLCQTINGFTVGSYYQITFQCSRRTSCGPNTQTMNFNINTGAFATRNISRTGGGFAFTTEVVTFSATATSHTISFTGTSAGTCGLVVDNISLTLLSALPIELVQFDVFQTKTRAVQIEWATASEKNNDYFSIERSKDGITWEEVKRVTGAGNSAQLLNYSTLDLAPLDGVSYYRLKQYDFDGQSESSNAKSVDRQSPKSNVTISPNPVHTDCIVFGGEYELETIRLVDAQLKDVSQQVFVEDKLNGTKVLNLSNLSSGVYYLTTRTTTQKLIKF